MYDGGDWLPRLQTAGDAVLAEQQPVRERSQEYLNDPDTVKGIIDEGCEAAREVARDTLDDVRHAMNLVYR